MSQITELFQKLHCQIYLYFHNDLFQTKNIIPRTNWTNFKNLPITFDTTLISHFRFELKILIYTHTYRKKKERKKEKDSKKMPLYKKNQLRNSRRSSSLKTSSSTSIPVQGRGGRKYRCALIPVEQIASEIW